MSLNNRLWTLISFLFVAIISLGVVRGNGVNLGALHWCDTLCLCHDETLEKMHCFEELEIYSLLEVDMRKVQRLDRANFRLKEKLTWCSETCLCHKDGRKEFKCSDNVKLGVFISEKAPFLAHYLEPEVEVFDVRDIVEHEDELPVEETSTPTEEKPTQRKDRHEKNKSRKHKKNKKKNHHQEVEEIEEIPQPIMSTTPAHTFLPETTTTERSYEVAPTTESDNRRLNIAQAIIPQASTGRGIPSRSPEPEKPSPAHEVPGERKASVGEVSNDLVELRENVDQIKEDVAFNQHILLVTVAVAAIAMIGVLILAIYSCCVRKSSKKTFNKPQRNVSQHQEENSVTKVNLDEAW